MTDKLKYRDEGKYCYYCSKKIGPNCKSFKCPNVIEESDYRKVIFVVCIFLFLMIGVYFYEVDYFTISR